jgi:hypothetical protein
MSGPKTVEYTLADAIVDAYQAYEADRLRRQAELARAQAEAEQARQEAIRRREEERRAREEARQRAELAAQRMETARELEQRLDRARSLMAQSGAGELPVQPGLPADTGDPQAVQHYIAGLHAAIDEVDRRRKALAEQAAADEGLRNLMAAVGSAVTAQPRTAAEVLALHARQATALHRAPAATAESRRAAAERVLGRLATLEAAEVPADLEALMRAVLEAPGETRAEALLMELRARVQRLNDERTRDAAAAQENRKREIAGEIVADTLADLGYEVEPIAETLFVEGGVAHFQRADWGDYYVRMRVDPAANSINVNMVRVTEGGPQADPATRRKDEEMESAWCAGLPKLLEELSARGVDVRKLRAVDPGALPVQAVKPEAVSESLRERAAQPRAAAAPRQMARPIK